LAVIALSQLQLLLVVDLQQFELGLPTALFVMLTLGLLAFDQSVQLPLVFGLVQGHLLDLPVNLGPERKIAPSGHGTLAL
jgi:hypothetical protein